MSAFFYVRSLGKLHLFLDLLFTNYGNIIDRLTNIPSAALLSSLIEKAESNFYALNTNRQYAFSLRKSPKSIRKTSAWLPSISKIPVIE